MTRSPSQKTLTRLESGRSHTVSEFNDPTREWRRLFAEWWGTFLVVAASAGGVLAHDAFPDKVSYAMGLAAPGIATTITIYMLGDVSGAHLNPGVTIAFALRGNFPWSRAAGYLAAQFVGALVAAAFVRLVFGPIDNLGTNTPGPAVSDAMAVTVEAVLTAGLIATILGSASGAKNVGPNAALAVGGYNILARYWAFPITGASMNTFRTLGPDLVRGDVSHTWIYLAGPLLGVLAGVCIEGLLKGRPSDAGDEAAQGEDAVHDRSDPRPNIRDGS
jgi:aquaporin Z